MFFGYTSKIDIQRSEPSNETYFTGSLDKVKKAVEKRNARIAEKVVIKSLIRKKPTEKSKVKLINAHEKDERIKYLSSFIESWNKWGDYYSDFSHRWEPKNRAQLTAIENILDLCKKEEIDCELFVACVWKSYEKRRFNPNVQSCLAYGLEAYDRYIDSIREELAYIEYKER